MRDINTILKDALAKARVEAVRHGGAIGYIPGPDGFYTDMAKSDVSWWTNGFWGGMMWQCWNATEDEVYRKAAVESEEFLDKAFSDFLGLHHDTGFMWLPTAGADYKITGNRRSYARTLHAATILAGRYNPDGHFIRSWNDDKTGWVIIDSLMNLSLLFLASRLTGDPRFRQIAVHHADKVMNAHIRENGSSRHIVSFDPDNGKFIESVGGQGKDEDSSWTRGQSWAVYGFLLAFLNTGDRKYLDTAVKTADHWLPVIEDCGFVFPVDFDDRTDSRTDCCAATVFASALIELTEVTGNSAYMDASLAILDKLDSLHADYDPSNDGIITGCTAAYHMETCNDVKMQYADYFYIEALLKLVKKNLVIWH